MADAKSVCLLIRYEARIRRSFDRALADLLRSKNFAAKPNPELEKPGKPKQKK